MNFNDLITELAMNNRICKRNAKCENNRERLV